MTVLLVRVEKLNTSQICISRVPRNDVDIPIELVWWVNQSFMDLQD